MTDDADDESDPVDALADAVEDREGNPFAALDADAGDRRRPEATNTDPGEAADGQDQSPDTTDPWPGPEAGEGEPVEPGPVDLEGGAIDELADEEIWEAIDGAQARGSVTETDERTYAEVSKHSYCERCRYFSGPPEVHCNHEGTEILEFPDLETVRVVDCPIVAERRELEREN